jgi:hypothetical protein
VGFAWLAFDETHNRLPWTSEQTNKQTNKNVSKKKDIKVNHSKHIKSKPKPKPKP